MIIAFTGNDGSGKTSLAIAVGERLVEEGLSVEYRRGGDDVSLFGFSTAPMNPPRRFGLTFRFNSGL